MIAARPARASRRSAILMGKGIGVELYYDVAVIGGGAVGLAYAIRGKRDNPELRVLVLEKAKEPRFKIGESTFSVTIENMLEARPGRFLTYYDDNLVRHENAAEVAQSGVFAAVACPDCCQYVNATLGRCPACGRDMDPCAVGDHETSPFRSS
jgi:hypothetical protein